MGEQRWRRRMGAVVGVLVILGVGTAPTLKMVAAAGAGMTMERRGQDWPLVDRVYVWASRARVEVERIPAGQPLMASVDRTCAIPSRTEPSIHPAEDPTLLEVDANPLYGLEWRLNECETSVHIYAPPEVKVGVDVGDGREWILQPGMTRLVILADGSLGGAEWEAPWPEGRSGSALDATGVGIDVE